MASRPRKRAHRRVDNHENTQPSSSGTTNENQENAKINWELCCLCQEYTRYTQKNGPQCPGDKDGTGYQYVAEVLQGFQDIGEHPNISVSMSSLDDGGGFETTFRLHSAKWHVTCRNKVSRTALARKKKALEKQNAVDSLPSPAKTRRTQEKPADVETDTKTCFFCGMSEGKTHQVMTWSVHFKVTQYAELLQDHSILAKLSAGDMIATEAMYHINCLTAFYRRANKIGSSSDSKDEEIQALAFAELVAYIESYRENDATAAVFSMPQLVKLYTSRLHELGAEDTEVHSTRLRNKLLSTIPDLCGTQKGREYILIFDKDIGDAIQKACSYDSDALDMVKAAQHIRRELTKADNSFNGKFESNCQDAAVPLLLQTFVGMILNGRSGMEEGKQSSRQSILTISQLLSFNFKKSSNLGATSRHSRQRETPLQIYLGLKIHAETRSKSLIDTLHSLGLCISYKRVLDISSDIANSVIQNFEREGVVVPPRMHHNEFTIGAVDNIDHNPSSTTSREAFHGTSISLLQPAPANDHGGEHGTPLIDLNQDVQGKRTITPLPVHYTDVLPVELSTEEYTAPPTVVCLQPVTSPSVKDSEDEILWLENSKKTYEENDSSECDTSASWSAYHAERSQQTCDSVSNIALMPLFLESAHTPAMIKHAMTVIQEATNHLNPGQTPVLVTDQPLFALAKQIQWTYHETHGEDKFFVMFGGLHIEQAAMKVLGDWLRGSGWTNTIVNSGFASTGMADSFLTASHLTRTRQAHQITAAALYILQHKAYSDYVQSGDGDILTFQEWCRQRTSKDDKRPQFAFWSLVLQLELHVLQLVNSFRTGDFSKYFQTLCVLLPWFFALDHVHYARWLSVHVRDICLLDTQHPDILKHFQDGAFVVHKTFRKFSSIALDQAHEQCNALVKGEGGAIGIFNNPNALRRWMIGGPEISSIIEDFERHLFSNVSYSEDHHDQQPSVQKAFRHDVTELVKAFEDLGNPFSEDSEYLIALDTKDIMPEEVVQTVYTIVSLGQSQYDIFVQERLAAGSALLSDGIKKNKLPLFSRPGTKAASNQKTSMSALKDDCSLFSRLYIACQSRDGDLDNFFKHENQLWPPSLSKLGETRTGNKADLLTCLMTKGAPDQVDPSSSSADADLEGVLRLPVEELGNDELLPIPDDLLDVDIPFDWFDTGFPEMGTFSSDSMDELVADILPDAELVARDVKVTPTPSVDALVLDGAAVVQMLHPKLSKTFHEYAQSVFMPYILRQLNQVSRIDVVWDVYFEDSLKAATRAKRGSGQRRRVVGEALIPGNWQGFLRLDKNKEELFAFLGHVLADTTVPGKVIISTYNSNVLTSSEIDVSELQPCNQEEADGRMLLHARHCVTQGFSKVIIRTTDTDVVVLAIAHAAQISASELWIAFGTGKHFRHIPVHSICSRIGERVSKALLFFHAFTGCDTVSFFAGRGKKTAWGIWRTFPMITDVFFFLSKAPAAVEDHWMTTLERYVVLLYDKTSTLSCVNSVRKDLFSRCCRLLENIPPTAAALKQHVLRAAYQGGHVWGTCLEKSPSLPSPSQWGWERIQGKARQASGPIEKQPWMPLWTTLPQASHSCVELIKCGCTKGCRHWCRCKKAKLSCTALCNCAGDCV